MMGTKETKRKEIERENDVLRCKNDLYSTKNEDDMH
jgi:hypothetical protein